jgi:RND family efflux transporter MFP subunit
VSRSKTARIVILALGGIAILWLGVAGYKALIRSGEKRPPVQTGRPVTEVEIITAKRGNVLTHLTGYGTVRGKREVLITPEVGGKIVSINPHFESGKIVRKGETLFAIDTSTIKVRIDQINGEISRLQAQIQTINQEAENIRRNLEIAADNVKLAEKEVKKNETLILKMMISERALDNSRQKYLGEKNSKINYENQLAMIPLKIKELDAGIAIRKAELADSQLKLEKSEVKTAFTGLIYEKNVEISQVVQAGQSAGMLIDVSVLEIPVDLNEENVGHFNFENFKKPGKYPCTVYWDAQKNNSAQWRGYISRIEKIDQTSRTIRVVVEVAKSQSSSDIFLAKGMFCRVILPGKRYQDTIAIPASALRTNDTVYILEEGKLQIEKVNILQRMDEEVVVGSGISDGDKVIISALENPVIGMELKARQPAMGGPI